MWLFAPRWWSFSPSQCRAFSTMPTFGRRALQPCSKSGKMPFASRSGWLPRARLWVSRPLCWMSLHFVVCCDSFLLKINYTWLVFVISSACWRCAQQCCGRCSLRWLTTPTLGLVPAVLHWRGFGSSTPITSMCRVPMMSDNGCHSSNWMSIGLGGFEPQDVRADVIAKLVQNITPGRSSLMTSLRLMEVFYPHDLPYACTSGRVTSANSGFLPSVLWPLTRPEFMGTDALWSFSLLGMSARAVADGITTVVGWRNIWAMLRNVWRHYELVFPQYPMRPWQNWMQKNGSIMRSFVVMDGVPPRPWSQCGSCLDLNSLAPVQLMLSSCRISTSHAKGKLDKPSPSCKADVSNLWIISPRFTYSPKTSLCLCSITLRAFRLVTDVLICMDLPENMRFCMCALWFSCISFPAFVEEEIFMNF